MARGKDGRAALWLLKQSWNASSEIRLMVPDQPVQSWSVNCSWHVVPCRRRGRLIQTPGSLDSVLAAPVSRRQSWVEAGPQYASGAQLYLALPESQADKVERGRRGADKYY